MIKITYESHDGKMDKPEITTVRIFNGKTFVVYSIPNKAQGVVDQMKKDGKKGVLYSKGAMIQFFAGKNEKEILEIVKKDIENGVYVAEKTTGKKIEIKNMEIEYK